MTPELAHILITIRDHGRPEILKEFRLDSCIGSTKIVARVLQNYGYEVIPFPVIVNIYNKTMTKMLDRGVKFPDEGPELSKMLDLVGAWSVGLGYTPHGYVGDPVGHLVAVMPAEKILVDASFDQASRPNKGMELPPVLVAKIDEDFLQGGAIGLRVNGCKVVYKADPDNKTYLRSSNWNIRRMTVPTARRIIKLIEETSHET